MTPEQERAEARKSLGELRVNEWYADKSSILIDGIPFLFSYAANHKSVTKVVELMKSHFNSLDREEQLLKHATDFEEMYKSEHREKNQLNRKVAVQDKEIQSWKDRADRAETILEKIMHGDQS